MTVLFLICVCAAFELCAISASKEECAISNGIVEEKGTRRPLTDAEKAKLERYEAEWEQWTRAFSAQFKPPFPFGGGAQAPPAAPKFPCICSECAQPATGRQQQPPRPRVSAQKDALPDGIHISGQRQPLARARALAQDSGQANADCSNKCVNSVCDKICSVRTA